MNQIKTQSEFAIFRQIFGVLAPSMASYLITGCIVTNEVIPALDTIC